MACNLNFNQCNTGRQFPVPIYNCGCRLANLLNSSNLQVVNPTTENSFLLAEIFAQTAGEGRSVQTTVALTRGDSIIANIDGSFAVTEGLYLLSYTISGAIPESGTLSFGVYENEGLISASVSSITGTSGVLASVTNSVIIRVDAVASYIALRGLNASQNVTGGNIRLQKL